MMGNVKPVWCLVLTILLVAGVLPVVGMAEGGNRTAGEATIASMPILFIPNEGQFEDNVSFQAQSSPEQVITVYKDGIEFSPSGNNTTAVQPVLVKLVGANNSTKIIGLNSINGTANYYYGTNSSAWKNGINLTTGVQYTELYPGIALNLSGKGGNLKSEYVVQAGADPTVIKLQYSGQESLSLNQSGDLIIKTAGRDIVDLAPVAYQEINGSKVKVNCSYKIGSDNSVSFTLGAYDKSKELVIDPVMRYSLYFGGDGRDQGNCIAVDNDGYAYFIGTTWSDHLKYLKNQTIATGMSAEGLAPGSVQPYYGGGDKDAFIIKINPDGTDLVYISYIGGSGTDEGTGLVIDKEGNAYIAGGTNSADFPVKNAFRNKISGGYDAWVAKLDPSGKNLVFSTYVGGTSDDFAYGLAIDDKKDVFITGETKSWDYPVVNRYQLSPFGGMSDAFITKLVPEGNSIVYSNFIGGSAMEAGSAVTIDPNGYACIVGQTESPNFQVIKPYQSSLKGTFNAFVTKFDPEGKYPAAYSTYLGGSNWDDGKGIIAHPDGSLTVVGSTKSPDFPTVNPIQPQLKGLQDGFIATLTPDGSSLNQSTYFGGSMVDSISAVAQDSSNSIYIVGTSDSPDLPTILAYQSKLGGKSDLMLTKFNPTISQIEYCTYLGGSDIDEGRGVAVTGEGDAYMTGYTTSINFPKVWPYQQNYGDGDRDAFVAVISNHDMIPVTDFVGVPTDGEAPLTVQFNDTSLGIPTSWAWEFGDGTNSTERNPVHVYEKPGVYTVSLTASNIVSSQKKTKENYITVREPVKPPVADFNANPQSGVIPLSVVFNDLTTNQPTAWSWVFGDGGSSQEQNPTHVYTVAGTYTVNLTASNKAGSSSKEKPQFINALPDVVKPVADFNANPTTGNAPLQVNFTDLSKNNPTAWRWDFGDGQTATQQNPTHVFTNPGVYSVTLNVSNTAGSDQITKPNLITANQSTPCPIADFTGAPTNGSAPLKVSFVDLSKNNPTTWAWKFGDGKDSVEKNPTHTYDAPGKYTVELVVTNIAGSDRKVIPDYINVTKAGTPPTAQFRGSPTVGIAPLTVSFTDLSGGNPTKWVWNFGDGSTSEEQHPVHVYQSVGEYTVTLTAKNEFGENTKVQEKYIHVLDKPVPLKAAFMGEPTSGVAPLNVKFTDLSTGNPTAWLWNFGDGTNGTDKNPNHVYTQPGDYTVLLTAIRGDDRSTEIRYQYIHVDPAGKPPVPDFVASPVSGKAPLTVCFTDLSSNNPTAWKWDFGDGQFAAEQNPTHVFQTPGTYTVCLEASNAFGSAKACKQNLVTVTEAKEPALFYGHITVDGDQAPCNTIVEARGNGVETGIAGNPSTTIEVGNYGIPDPLKVQGTIKNGEPVTFWVKTPGSADFVKAECYDLYGKANWTDSYPFRGGEKTRLDLRVGGEGIPPMPVLPHEFFGEVTYNGQPLPVGSTISVKGDNIIEGHVGNPLPVTSPGVYGFEKLQRLVAQGDLKGGQPLTFWVTPSGSNEAIQAQVRDVESGGDWASSFAYFEGGLTRLSLRADGGKPPVPTTPMTVSGTVMINGLPVAPGSLITADGSGVKIGVENNPIQVNVPGKFGDKTKLTVQGNIPDGSPISFKIYDAVTGQEHVAEVKDQTTGQWVKSYPFTAGSDVVLDLRSTGIIPMAVNSS